MSDSEIRLRESILGRFVSGLLSLLSDCLLKRMDKVQTIYVRYCKTQHKQKTLIEPKISDSIHKESSIFFGMQIDDCLSNYEIASHV